MPRQRNDFKAGLFIVISFILVVAIIVGIKGVGRMFQPAQHPIAVFKLTDDIGGLNVGDDVRVGGLKVGVVRDIEIVTGADNQPMIEVGFSIPQRYVIHKDARLTVQGTLTGSSWLNFETLGSGPAIGEHERIVGRPSAMSVLFASVGELAPEITSTIMDVRSVTLPKVNTTIDTFRGTGTHATALVKAIRAKLDPIVDRYYALADTGKDALAQIRDVFGESKTDIKGTFANVNAATGSIKEKLPSILDKASALITNIDTSINKASGALEDVREIAANGKTISASAKSILISNRGKIDSMIASLKETGDNLKFGTAEIRRSPWRLLYKPGPGEMANLNLYDAARQFADGASDMSDAAQALRDALAAGQSEDTIQRLVEKLDKSFANFTTVEADLWAKVKE